MMECVVQKSVPRKLGICGLPGELLVLIFRELDIQTLFICKMVSIKLCPMIGSTILTLNIL